MPVEAAMDGKRRRLHDAGAGHPVSPPSKRRRDDGDHDARASKKQAEGRASSASAVAQLSCARIRPYVRVSRGKINPGDNAKNIDRHISCIGGTRAAVQAPRPTKASTQVRARAVAVADDVLKKQKAGQGTSCTSTRPAVQASRPNEAIKVSGGGPHGVTKKQQESGERVQAIATASIPQLAHPVPPSKPKDPFEADNAFPAAIARARQALVRRQREAARRERDKMVQTVYFNDPNLTLENVLKAQPLIGSC